MKSNSDAFKTKAELFALKTHGGIFTTKGTSMLPLIKQGTRVEIQPILSETIRIGTVIAYSPKRGIPESKDNLIAHRVVGMVGIFSKRLFLMKGDNETSMELINSGQIIGRVNRIVDNANGSLDVNQIPPAHVPAIFYVFYFFLLQLKRTLFGSKRYKLTSAASSLYWRIADTLSGKNR